LRSCYDLRIWQLANGSIPDTPRPLDPAYAGYAARPTTGPHQPGAIDLGYGGYRVPTYEEQCQIAFAEQARIRAALVEAEKKRKLP
jgi:hypothetical protein